MPHVETYSLKDAICGCCHLTSHCGMNQTSPKSLSDCSMMMTSVMTISKNLSCGCLTSLNHCDNSMMTMTNYCGCSTMMSLSDS